MGPFTFAVATDNAAVAADLQRIYQHVALPARPDFVDFDLSVRTRLPWRRFIKPQVDFFRNEQRPFKPLPRDQGYAMLEWGMNWCVANHAHQYLIVHAGVVERNGKAIVMPAVQGAGKSTLTAALAYSGWRLFSDELALLGLADAQVHPFPRAINLKNDAVGIIADFIGGGVFSRTAHDTSKGSVALLQPPVDSLRAMRTPAPPAVVVFPSYVPGSGVRLTSLPRPAAFEEVIGHCFNYHLLGLEAFELLYGMFSRCECYRLEYSDFALADAALTELVA
ncbi:HprK-related kinase A [Kineobactrum salinum]|uniref:HprK-related kinase A n=1 Tax=Kineobactrum salinum TaxID=2708301 RepID=A0A6C0UBQ5_9GAMM|nr:HprK-related kinase A [Kineobactrum salinum]